MANTPPPVHGSAQPPLLSNGRRDKASSESIWGHFLLLGLCTIYLLNFTLGIDLIPDNFPLIGNIDEVGATLMAMRSFRRIREIRAEKRIKDKG